MRGRNEIARSRQRDLDCWTPCRFCLRADTGFSSCSGFYPNRWSGKAPFLPQSNLFKGVRIVELRAIQKYPRPSASEHG